MTSTRTSGATQLYHRVVLTLNLGGDDSQNDVLEHTLHFAVEFNSSLTCLCVRDTDLLDYAGLPFAREFSIHGALTRSLNADDVRNDMDRRASAIRQALEDLTTRQQRQSSFLVVDGRMDEKVVETAEENDLIVMAISPPIQRTIGATYEKIRKIMAHRPCDILLVPQTHQSGAGAVAVLVGETIPSERALQLAFQSAHRRHVGVDFFTDDGAELLKSIRDRSGDILGMLNMPTPDLSFHSLNQRLSYPWRRYPCSFMIVEFDDLPPLDLIDRSLRAFDSPMLLLQRKRA